jgi:hypothetical protein
MPIGNLKNTTQSLFFIFFIAKNPSKAATPLHAALKLLLITLEI